MPNRFFCFDHQTKSRAFTAALLSHGWEATKDPHEARILLSDSNVLNRGKSIDVYSKRGAKVFIYPHAAIPNLFWDMKSQNHKRPVACQFVPAPGHIKIMRAYGFPYPLEAVGWHLSPIRPFKPKREIKRILFGPIHPNSNGFLCNLHRSINRRAFEMLLQVSDICGADLAVRYIGELQQNGIRKAPGVVYFQGEKNLSFADIDGADLVVSTQTFLYLAVSRGIPALGMGENHPIQWGASEDKLESPSSWEKYIDIMRYPLDILDGSDPIDAVSKAIDSDEAIRDWRERMIGKRFDPDLFVKKVEEYLS